MHVKRRDDWKEIKMRRVVRDCLMGQDRKIVLMNMILDTGMDSGMSIVFDS